MKTTIINLYGGPGAGKSTSAARIYHLLKDAGENAEMVREYVKDWAWMGQKPDSYDQLYLLAKQIRKETILFGKVDYVVSDSPVMLGIYYSRMYGPPAIARGCQAAIEAFYEQAGIDGHEHIHVLLKRSKAYNPAGRFQNEEQAKSIDDGVERMLKNLDVPFRTLNTNDQNYIWFVDALREEKSKQ